MEIEVEAVKASEIKLPSEGEGDTFRFKAKQSFVDVVATMSIREKSGLRTSMV